MMAHIGVDRDSGLMHTAANVVDITQAAALLHGKGMSAPLALKTRRVQGQEDLLGDRHTVEQNRQVA